MSRRPQIMGVREFKGLIAAGAALPAEGVQLRKGYLAEVKQVEGEEHMLDFTISTGVVDRDGDTIKPEGWQLENYQQNPVVLFAHNYGELPVAKSPATWLEDGRLRSKAQFPPRELYEFGDLVYRMYAGGYIRAASVGFQPKQWAQNEDRGGWCPTDFLIQELLEWSCVPVPANPEALLEARAKGLDVRPMVDWAERFLDTQHGEKGLWVPRELVERIHGLLAPHVTVSLSAVPPVGTAEKGVVPSDVSRDTADEGEEWRAPTLSDFTEETWDDLDDAEKRKIAGHFAWADSNPPETYAGLKLPHHRASDGKVVWRGVAAAMAVLLGGRGGVDIPDADRRKVYDHLSSHYGQFDKEPPEFEAAAEDDKGEHNQARITLKLDLEGMGPVEALVQRLEAAVGKASALGASDGPGGEEPVLEIADEVTEEETVEPEMLLETVRETVRAEIQALRTALTGRLP